ncbi:MAG: 50S ribosomal protein L18 [Myxococcota bacterium]|nr:50S ribosomal protein L18 [Myxococcota bacterium]MEC8381142.1 50S ribosomal protein L18 [Myxococcota bacterium]
MSKTNIRHLARQRRKKNIRKRVVGSSDRPRLTVFRSAKHIYAQLIDDSFMVDTTNRFRSSKTLVTVSSLSLKQQGGNKDGASLVGTEIAKKALEAGVKSVVFDRNGYLYHGRVKALADAAREAGLQF